MKAQKRLPTILRYVFFDNFMADTTLRKSPLISTIFAVSIATSVPEPIAIPTSACANAGASLIPSPTIVTTASGFSVWIFLMASAFSLGRTSAKICSLSIPSSLPMLRAVSRLSPVSMKISSPISRNCSSA